MSPEKGRSVVERLAVLETKQDSMETSHRAAMSQITERQDAHEEAVEKRFLAVESTSKSTHDLLYSLNDTMIRFISTHDTKEQESEKKGLKLWQILAVVGAFVGPSVFEKIISMVFGG